MAYGYEVSQEESGCGVIWSEECDDLSAVFDVLEDRGVRWYSPGVEVHEQTGSGWKRIGAATLEGFGKAFTE
jgi:hypothetical protein